MNEYDIRLRLEAAVEEAWDTSADALRTALIEAVQEVASEIAAEVDSFDKDDVTYKLSEISSAASNARRNLETLSGDIDEIESVVYQLESDLG